jgi:hypothetical protein
MNKFPDDAPLPPKIGQRIAAGFAALYAEHPRIVTTTERAVVGRLLVHLTATFATNRRPTTEPDHGYVWDVEYMRSGDNAKELRPLKVPTRAPGDRRPTVRRIAPDLVWHRRLFDMAAHPSPVQLSPPNLIAVEVKLDAQGPKMLSDWAKLALLTGAAENLEWYTTDLRLPGSAKPGQQEQLGTVRLPDAIAKHPYEHGLSLNIDARGVTVHVFSKDMQWRGENLETPTGYRWTA